MHSKPLKLFFWVGINVLFLILVFYDIPIYNLGEVISWTVLFIGVTLGWWSIYLDSSFMKMTVKQLFWLNRNRILTRRERDARFLRLCALALNALFFFIELNAHVF